MKESNAKKLIQLIENEDYSKNEKLVNQSILHDDIDEQELLADYLFSNDFLSDAKKIYQSLFKKKYSESVALSLSEIELDSGNPDEALSFINKIDEQSDQYLPSLLIKADIYQTQGLFENAENMLKKTLEIDDDLAILFSLAELYFSNQLYSQAISFYKAIILRGNRTFANTNIIYRLIESYFAQNNLDNVIGYGEQLNDDELGNSKILNILSTAYLENDEKEKAVKLLNDAIELDSSQIFSYLQLIDIYEKDGKIDEAYRLAQLAATKNEFDAYVFQKAGELAVKNKSFSEAKKYLLHSLDIDDSNIDALLDLVDLSINQLNDTKSSNEYIEQFVEKNADSELSENPLIKWRLAIIADRNDEPKKAFEYFLQANEQLYNDAEFLKEYGAWLRENGEVKKSNEVFKNYLLLNNDEVIQQLVDDE